jgi:hypothetical protein
VETADGGLENDREDDSQTEHSPLTSQRSFMIADSTSVAQVGRDLERRAACSTFGRLAIRRGESLVRFASLLGSVVAEDLGETNERELKNRNRLWGRERTAKQ